MHLANLRSAKSYFSYLLYCEKIIMSEPRVGGDQLKIVRQEGILEKIGLKWLQHHDQEVTDLFYNRTTAKVFVTTCEYSFGLIQKEPNEVHNINETIEKFRKVKDKPAILVIFMGLANHWVCLVAHHPGLKNLSPRKQEKLKQGQSLTKIYMLDSANTAHLHIPVEQIPEFIIERQRDKIRVGMNAWDKFGVKMTIQCYYDIRTFCEKLTQIFWQPLNQSEIQLTKIYTNGRI